jgi:hypothetical protein
MDLHTSTASRAAPPSMLSLSCSANAPQYVANIMSWYDTKNLLVDVYTRDRVRVGMTDFILDGFSPDSGTGTYP